MPTTDQRTSPVKIGKENKKGISNHVAHTGITARDRLDSNMIRRPLIIGTLINRIEKKRQKPIRDNTT